MKHALFVIKPSYNHEDVLKELQFYGLKDYYLIEEFEESDKIGGFFDQLPPLLSSATLLEYNEGIDWDKEWKTHSPYYKNGLLEIDLNDFGARLIDSKIYLEPGPGFGDLSHPTTYLMLKIMASHIQGKDVIDIGCGSGILSLAAYKMGASSVLGIDIEDDALEHSRKNALLNNMNELRFHKSLNIKRLNNKNTVFLINMTFHEQKNVFSSYPDLSGTFIISGLLKDQKTTYLKEIPYTRKPPVHSFEKKDWMGMLLYS